MYKKFNKKGFTLVEILAVIIIIGIVALIAVPSVRKFIDEAKVKKCEADKSAISDLIKADITEKTKNNENIPFIGTHALECFAATAADTPTATCSGKYGITEIKDTIDSARFEKYKSRNVTVTETLQYGVTEYEISFVTNFCN